MLFLKTRLRKRLLAYTFTHSEENFYVRELAALINEDPGNLSRELRRLEAEGLYKSVARGKEKFYSLNRDYSLFQELKKMIFKTEGVAGTLKSLIDGYPGISLAFLYGSYAKEQEKASSDIDLIVVGQLARDKFTRQIRGLEEKFNREINFNAYTKEEFDKERRKEGGFLDVLLKERIFLLKGQWNAA